VTGDSDRPADDCDRHGYGLYNDRRDPYRDSDHGDQCDFGLADRAFANSRPVAPDFDDPGPVPAQLRFPLWQFLV